MPPQQRKFVFFLGAGASYGAGATATVQRGAKIAIPTQASFWETFLRFCSSRAHERAIESFLFRYFLGYGRVPSRLSHSARRKLLARIDVEEVFTFLSERIRAPGTTIQLRTSATLVWDALTSEIGPVFSRFTANSSTRHTFRALHKNYIRGHDTVVSFNYDTVFESSLPQSVPWHYECIEPGSRSLRILKPHGSANWAAGELITREQAPGRAVVVAPTHLKFVQSAGSLSHDTDAGTDTLVGYLDQSLQIENVWAAMEREMRAAKALVFIGYSFPPGDLYFASVLRGVLALRDSTPSIVIVNPDAVAIENRILERFALRRSIKYFELESFVHGSRNQLLSMIR